MKTMPWQDIFTLAQWNSCLKNYKSGKTQSKAKTRGDRFKRFFTRKYQLPRTIRNLDMQIRHYHKTKKRSIDNLQRRAGALRTIAGLARCFLAEHDIANKNVLKQSMDETAYKAYKKKTLDYSVSKVARRAERKAEYIEKLMQHLANADKGFASGKQDLLEYIKSKSYEPEDENLIRMGPDVVLEKIDPWHRTYEATFNIEKMTVKAPVGSSIFAAAFKQWIYDTEHADLPFFVWLEGHYVCTNTPDQRLMNSYGDIAYDEPQGHVGYYRFDQELESGMPFITLQNGLLWEYRFDADGNFESVDLYNTKYKQSSHPEPRGGKGLTQAHAYAWSKEGFIFAGPHIGRMFHHSSFVSGKKVRCAGMICVTNGKVTRLDNDSGHYKPATRHLRNFAQYLHTNNAFAQDARIEDKSVKPNIRVSATEFLAGDRVVGIRRKLEALKAKRTTLHKLVQDRFEEMKADIGPAPEHLLWTRAYKAVCLNFAELDQTWIRRANAPAIPRSRAKG